MRRPAYVYEQAAWSLVAFILIGAGVGILIRQMGG